MDDNNFFSKKTVLRNVTIFVSGMASLAAISPTNSKAAALHDFMSTETLTAKNLNDNFTALNNELTNSIQLGDSANAPGINCLDIFKQRSGITSGIYWVKTSNSPNAFRVYCDMTANNGGWTLVWSNLRGSRGKPFTDLHWGAAINTLPRYQGEPSSDIQSFIVYTGLKYWTELGTTAQIRYDWASEYRYPLVLDQSYSCEFSLNTIDRFKVHFTAGSCTQHIGSVIPGMVSYHNDMPFSTLDQDNDTHGTNHCAKSYNAPWWYGTCEDGAIVGQGEVNGNDNGAYWSKYGDVPGKIDGTGYGNGWIFIR
jgi:hypothetical protein